MAAPLAPTGATHAAAEPAPRLAGAGAIGFARLWAQGLQLLLFLVAARLLGVADFGWFSLLFAITTGLTVLAEGGWREQAIAADDVRLALASHGCALRDGLLWMACGATLLLALYGLGPARVGVSPAVLTMGALLLPWVALRPLAAVRAGLLTRTARLGTLALVQSLAEAAACAVGVLLLLNHVGLAALVWAKLALLVTELTGLALVGSGGGSGLGGGIEAGGSRWRGRADRAERAAMRRFSRQIRSARVLNFLQWNLATLLAGLVFAPFAVGLYRAAIRLAGLVQDVIGEPVRVFGWALLRRTVRDDRQGLRDGALRFMDATLSLACAPLLVLALQAEPILRLVLGPAWSAAAPLLALLALGAMARLVTMTTDPLLPLIGRADLTQRLAHLAMVANAAALLLAVVLARRWGITGVAAAGLLAGLVTLVPALRMLADDAGLGAGGIWRAALPTLGGALAVLAIRPALPDVVVQATLPGLALTAARVLGAYALGQVLLRLLLYRASEADAAADTYASGGSPLAPLFADALPLVAAPSATPFVLMESAR